MKPSPAPEHAQVRIWFWNQAGAQHLICPLSKANDIRTRLISEAATILLTEIYHP